MKKGNFNKTMNRFYIICFGLLILAIAIFFKLIFIQYNEGSFYKNLAKKRTVKNFELQASRGNIFSDDKSLLATSVTKYMIRWDSKAPNDEKYEKNINNLSQKLSLILNKSKEHYKKLLDNGRKNNNRYLLIANNLSFSQYNKIKNLPLFNLPSIKGGLIVETKVVRAHPIGKIAERTIGYEKKDPAGHYIKVGLEGAFGQILKGENGRRLKQKIANGQWKPINDNNEKEPTEGFDIYSTLNINIQDIAHHALLSQLEKYNADHGTVVVMETNSGDIKAISNLGKTKSGKYYEKLNYAIGEAHEPGSTFKLMSIIAALEDKVISGNDFIETGNGEITFFNKYKVKDSNEGGYGKITTSKAFELSSNTAIVKIINENYKNNPEQFVNRLYDMGLNKPLGLPIKGEGLPKIPYPSDSNWSGLNLPWMAFGYGILLTPLQILTFYNSIANNGEMVKPKFINKVSGYEKGSTKVFKKEVINPSICSSSTLSKVKKMLYNVVDKKWGTAHLIKDSLFSISGKTGTCQVDYAKNEVQYISSFVGYFPSNDPIYSCIVVIHKPDKKKGYYGSQVAAPVFKEIAKKIYNSTPKLRVFDIKKSNKNYQKSLKIEGFDGIPDLKGLPAMDALSLLENMGLKVVLKGTGKVINQSIKKGVKVSKNQKIILELS